jgi:ABC-type transport system involved in cytochrome c biogenesis permease subunit
MGFILAGFTMLVASLAGSNPQITHLMPVLQSPLLSIHVLCMMVSYTLFGLVALNGIMGLLMPLEASAKLRDVSLVILYPAVFILTTGTFIGAVWANISWGNYWSWDPKETWALITMLIYAAMLHSSTMSRFSKPRFFHAYSVAAIIAVLITYFGVNLVLGGMHAYA